MRCLLPSPDALPASRRSTLLALALGGLLLSAPSAAEAAPHGSSAARTSAVRPSVVREVVLKIGASLPARPEVWLSPRLRGDDLTRIKVGDQAGLLKVTATDGVTDLFIKDDPRISIKALDTVYLARISTRDRSRVMDAIGVGESEIATILRTVADRFDALPQRQAVALLGVLAAAPDAQLDATGPALRAFLARTLLTSQDVSLRRQCVLSLAIAGNTDEASIKAVITFMTQSHNAWETFTTQQFFQYHGDAIRALPNAVALIEALVDSGNPYAADLAASLRR